MKVSYVLLRGQYEDREVVCSAATEAIAKRLITEGIADDYEEVPHVETDPVFVEYYQIVRALDSSTNKYEVEGKVTRVLQTDELKAYTVHLEWTGYISVEGTNKEQVTKQFEKATKQVSEHRRKQRALEARRTSDNA